MCTKTSEINLNVRKESVDKRLKEIESEWSDNDVLEWLNKHYDEHCDTHGFCQVSGFIEEREFLQVWVECVGRPIMAKIYDRSKFVEVGENDKLSLTTLWLNYLVDIGATVEVCHVHSISNAKLSHYILLPYYRVVTWGVAKVPFDRGVT
ncbi:hypothetical protein NQ317_006636 [Molorchus minor]|uniref:Uncharacterized protein n=1 Tax=Molorchus minor TaxID=1323400 RepID=A0ABQ9IVG7_9CUCU|nr:hypothetical protein NQ317_006636 [Molorchus minor]